MTAPTPPRRNLSFSLRTLFVAVTLIAIWFALFSKFGWEFAELSGETVATVAGISWFWAMVDSLANETKFRWVMVVLLGHIPGGVFYLVYRRPRRTAECARTR